MKAIGLMKYGEPEVLRLIELPVPIPGPRQVRIAVDGVSINYADIQTRRGTYHAGSGSFPVIPGLDLTGVVEAIGEGVTRLVPGQRVIAFPSGGSYMEYVLAEENLAFPVPDCISFDQAAACPLVTFTAMMLLRDVANLEPNETLVIYAASGGVGTSAIQIAKAMGSRVVGIVGSEEKKACALKAGADAVYCHRTEDIVRAVKADFSGADVVLDSLGGGYTANALEMLNPYGRLVAFGNASGSYYTLDTQLLHASCRSVRGFSIGSTRRMRPERFAPAAEAVFQLMTAGKLHLSLSRILPLEQAAAAHGWIESGRNTGKVVLTVR